MPGATVCSKHGASAPQVRAAAQRRVAEQQAREVAQRMDVDVAQFDGNPIAALHDLLARDQAEMERYSRLATRLEDHELTYTTRSGIEQMRAVLGAYQAERDTLGKHLDLLLRAGIAHRMIEVRESQHKTAQTGLAELFKLVLTLFLGDVSSALADAGAFQVHDQVMSRINGRVQRRLEHEQTLIIRQVEIAAAKDAGPAQGR
jgi:hypothetical protein